MKEPPKVRQNGKCYVCAGPRTFNYQRGVPRWAYERDPFCSSACARKFYGTETSAGEMGKQRPGYVAESHRGVPIKLKKTTKQAKYA